MRYDTVRFGVRTNKTLRKQCLSSANSAAEQLILKSSNAKSSINLYGGDKLLISAKDYEELDKKCMRKR